VKRKYFFVVLFLILAIFLSGCSGIITDEEKVRDVINEYFLAINDQDWDKVKSCCIYGSNVYYETCLLEDKINDFYQFFDFVTIIFSVDKFDIVITGDYANAYIDGSLTIITDISYVFNDSSTFYSSGHFYLQKVSNNWKIVKTGDYANAYIDGSLIIITDDSSI